MKTDRGWKRFYATGWLVAAVVGAVGFTEWLQRVRAVEEKLAESERARQAVVQRVAAEERLRIARELHDSLTHSISVIKVQSGVAAHLARKRGEEVPEALTTIQEAAGDAALELRETLGILRRDGEHNGRGAGELRRLVESARAAGLQVELEVIGLARVLPYEVDAAIYRIAQEALTNVSRHAGPTTVRVRLCYDDAQVRLQVDDDGLGHDGVPASAGLGLRGMRERTAALGGRLVARGQPDGGFTVRAELPDRSVGARR
ncbi:sensor histidine kinase [Pseudactinotalea sp. Z1732]|uniref:sensor histidine kinase n=1 Tax=Pseudactinotalea sp. Z1732 TaxID=3413026 RepID=UPI003C7A2CF0